jgi:hypothetical protein
MPNSTSTKSLKKRKKEKKKEAKCFTKKGKKKRIFFS